MKPLAEHLNLPERIRRAEAFLQSRKDVFFSYLFGSAASGRTHGMSDMDIAVYLEADPSAEERLDLLGGLMDAVKTDRIDLVVLNSAPLPLKARVIRSRRLLSDSAPFVRHAFESATLRAYLDFSILETRILERRYLHGR